MPAGSIRAIDVDTSRDLYQILLTAFVSAMRGEGRPTVTGEEGLGALKVALAAEAIRTQRQDRRSPTWNDPSRHELSKGRTGPSTGSGHEC